jgi:hypothetical protein
MAARAIPNAAVQWTLQVGTRQAALQSRRGMLANVVNFLTEAKHIAPAAQNGSNGVLIVIRNIWNNNIITTIFTTGL